MQATISAVHPQHQAAAAPNAATYFPLSWPPLGQRACFIPMTEPTRKAIRTGYALSALAALGFGLAPAGAKLAYAGGAEPLTLALFRFILCVAGVSAIAFVARHRLWLPWPTLIRVTPLCCTMAISSLAYLAAIDRISVSLTVVIVYLFPVFVFVFSILFKFTPASPIRLSAFAVAFFGVILAVGDIPAGAQFEGLLFAFIAGLSIASSTLFFSRKARSIPGLTLAFWGMSGAAVITSTIALFGPGITFPVGSGGWTGFAIGVACFAMALVAFYLAVSRIGPIKAAMLANSEPIIAILTAMVLVGERPTIERLMGAGLIVSAIVAMHWADYREKAQSGTQGS